MAVSTKLPYDLFRVRLEQTDVMELLVMLVLLGPPEREVTPVHPVLMETRVWQVTKVLLVPLESLETKETVVLLE